MACTRNSQGMVRQNVTDRWARKGTSHQHLTANEEVFHLLQGCMRVVSATKSWLLTEGCKTLHDLDSRQISDRLTMHC